MINKNLLMIGLLAGTALAQTAAVPAKQTAAPATATKPATAPAKPAAAKPTAATKPAQAASKPAQTVSKPALAAGKPASQTVKPTTAAPKKAVVAPAAKPKAPVLTPTAKKAMAAEAKAKAPKPVAKKTDTATVVKTAGRRDPFISPIRLQEDKMKSTSVCTTGARCLIIDQVVLKGVVKTTSGMIAMVENAAKKQYNLKEKDPVFNGFVLKISGDSVVFRETITDNLGKQTAKEVVKRVTAPVI
jgi:Tfp pilus assembly protein PilP